MNYFTKFSNWLEERRVRGFSRGIINAMLFSFLAFENYAKKGKIKIKTYNDLAIMALSTRPQWKEIEKSVFEYKSGKRIYIQKDYTLADITLCVIFYELEYRLKTNNIPENIFNLSIDEFRKKYNTYSDVSIHMILSNIPSCQRALFSLMK